MKKILIVVPMYNEEEMAPLFFEAVDKVLETIKGYDFEYVAVNDGSKDTTLDVLKGIQEKKDNLVIVNLSRNFGHESAVHAGLMTATGDAVIPMDADLQDPPSIIPEMVKMWEEGYQVVNAQRSSRKADTGFKRNTAGIYYKFISKMSPKVKIPQNVANFRLIDRRVVDEVNSLKERNRVLRIQIPFVGFKVGTVTFVRPKREKGETKYDLSSMFNLAVSSIISLTSKPLFSIPLGLTIGLSVTLCISGLAELVLFILTCCGVFPFINSLGYGIWLIGNILLLLGCLFSGVLTLFGAYFEKIAEEAKDRPDVIINEVIKK